jgi:hypothetical protein
MRIDRLSYTRRRKPLFPFEPNTTPAAPVRVGLRSPKHLGPLTPAPRPRPEGALRFRAAGLRGGVSEIWSPVAGLAYPSGKNNFVRTRARVTRTRNGRYVEEYCLFVSAPFLRTFSVTS